MNQLPPSSPGQHRSVEVSWPDAFYPERWLFLHVQKSGGTALKALLDSMLPANSVCPDENGVFQWYSKEDLLRFKFFRGHINVVEASPILQLPGKIKTFTILRCPVAQALSVYRYTSSVTEEFANLPGKAHHKFFRNHSLVEVLDEKYPFARETFFNTIARQFSGSLRADGTSIEDEEEYFDIALQNLETLGFIGFQHDLQRSAKLLLDYLDVSSTETLSSHNVTSDNHMIGHEFAETPFQALTEQERECIDKLTRIDQRLYEHFLRKYLKRHGDITHPLLTSDTVTVAEQEGRRFAICEGGVSAWTVYGPYNHLSVGRYRVTFHLAVSAEQALPHHQTCATIDICGHNHEVSLARLEVTAGQIACARDTLMAVTLDLHLTSPEEKVQYRVVSHGVARLIVEASVRIETLFDSP